ncbi:MAG: ParB/RepB/Spo0J family partition protein [bacterium]|nr:ParB/RepB/Spo0J family partition protein [bacterium]
MNKKIVKVRIEDIIPNRFQSEVDDDELGMDKLVNTIKINGLTQPLVLSNIGNKYEVVAGSRLYKAAILAKLTEVPAYITNNPNIENKANDKKIKDIIESNNLSLVEEATVYSNELNNGMTIDELSNITGKSNNYIYSKVKILNLNGKILNAIHHNKISEEIANILLDIEDETFRDRVFNNALNNQLSTKETLKVIEKMKSHPFTMDPYLKE